MPQSSISRAGETGSPAASGTRRATSRRIAMIGVLALLVLAATLASLAFGSNRLGLPEVIDGLLHPGSGGSSTIIYGVRIPRTVLGLLVGVCLGVAGALMQGHTRNPLADPGLFGVSSGAGLAIVIGVYVFGVVSTSATVWLALAGALIASVIVFSVTASGSDTASPVPLALAGAAVSALLDAFTSFLVLGDRATLEAYRRWVVGSLSGRELDVATAVIPFAIVGLLLAAYNSRALDNLSLGSDLARGLGENVLVARLVGLASITLLTAAATAAAGPIGFVGLVVPHLARPFVGVAHRWLLPASALIGATLVLAADVIGRLIGGTAEVEVGIVLALVGGPFFVWVARRRSLVSL